MPVLDVNNAAFSYDHHHIFRDICFQVGAGDIMCLLGPNGCGKTTLLDCILGVLKLDSGSIRFGAKDARTLQSHEIARIISYVPQHHTRHFSYSVLDVILLGRTAYTPFYASPTKKDIRIAESILSDMGLMELRDRDYTTLSGGESQLVLIMRALAQETPVIIMDEPTAHLDFRNELQVLETMVNLVRERGISIVMATHFPNHAFYLENNGIPVKVALMENGLISHYGHPADVLNCENIQKVYGIHAEIISFSFSGKNAPSYGQMEFRQSLCDDAHVSNSNVQSLKHLKQVIPMRTVKDKV